MTIFDKDSRGLFYHELLTLSQIRENTSFINISDSNWLP